MSEYDIVRRGKLVLKGETSKYVLFVFGLRLCWKYTSTYKFFSFTKNFTNRKRKHKHSKKDKQEKDSGKAVVDEDAVRHGGWWKAQKFEEITGSVALEFGNRTYITALDNGLFTLGAPHDEGDGPAPEEIFTAFPINDSKVAFKSGYGKYLRVEKDGMVTGRSDAVSAVEQFEPVFQVYS